MTCWFIDYDTVDRAQITLYCDVAQTTIAAATHAKFPDMVGALMGWIGEGRQAWKNGKAAGLI